MKPKILEPKNFSPVFKDRFLHLTYAFNKCSLKGHILEFGVFKGYTIKHIASLTNDTIYGFDSFKSLPEPWDQGNGRIEYKERFKIEGPPEVPEHVKLIIGWFDVTIKDWAFDYSDEMISFLHIDSDIYSSCKEILTELDHMIVPGTVIVFDEMFGYKNYKQHEHKACLEWLNNNNREVEFLGRTNKYGASMRVIK